jgi:hypothetical protein
MWFSSLTEETVASSVLATADTGIPKLVIHRINATSEQKSF